MKIESLQLRGGATTAPTDCPSQQSGTKAEHHRRPRFGNGCHGRAHQKRAAAIAALPKEADLGEILSGKLRRQADGLHVKARPAGSRAEHLDYRVFRKLASARDHVVVAAIVVVPDQEALDKRIPLVEIIPGKGSGQLKKKVLRYLQQPQVKKLYHRIDKDRDNFGRLFVRFKH